MSYRQSTTNPGAVTSQTHPSYFLPSSPPPAPASYTSNSSQLQFQNIHPYQSQLSQPQSPFSHSDYFQHQPFSNSRRSEGFEPMNTSPTQPQQLQATATQSCQYLPSFLTGEVQPTHHHHNLIAPEPTSSFDGPEASMSHMTVNPALIKPAGPPVSGLGEVSGIENSAASFEQRLAVANNKNVKLTGFTPPTTPPNNLKDSSTWVTVFGFPASAATYVLTNFSQYGTILQTKANPGSNWLHLKYSNKIEARRALNRNGTVLGGTMMIGVIPHEEPTEEVPVSRIAAASTSKGFTSPGIREGLPGLSMSRPGSSASGDGIKENLAPNVYRDRENKFGIRPLAQSNNSSLMGALPKENTGVLARALDYMFGW